jgi:PAS domain S-box-containing protein
MRTDGTVRGWNVVAEKVFGWSTDQAVGHQLSNLIIPHAFREAHHQGLAKYLETGEGPVLNRHFEITALRSTGEEFPVELSITPTKLGTEEVFLGFLRDISDRKAAEAIIRRRAAEAETVATLTSLAAEAPLFEVVMRRCLESVCAITNWKLAHAFCSSEEEPDLLEDTGIWHNPDGADIAALVCATANTEFRRGRGLPGRALEHGTPVWVTNVEQETNFARLAAAAALGLHSAFAFPIRAGSRTIAVLEFFHHEMTEPDLTLWPTLQTLGEQVGRVFERTRATEMLRQERQSLLAEIARREELEQHQQLLLNELNHRVKNTLAVVSGIAQQTAKSSVNVAEFNATFSGRLSALAAAHSVLTRESWQAAPLKALIEELLRPFSATEESRVSVDGPELTLSPKAVLALSLIIHELLTNAIKHGALSVATGSLEIKWEIKTSATGRLVALAWRERGLQDLTAPELRGFGTKLLIASVRHELRGQIDQHWHLNGLELQIEFPVGES